MARTEIDSSSLPNLIDGRPWSGGIYGRIYHYSRNADGSIHVRAGWAGLGDGIGAGGKRFATLEDAAAAVRVAREKVAASWSRARWYQAKGWTFQLEN